MHTSSINKKIMLIIGSIGLMIIICFGVLKFMDGYQHITLQSTWQSEETSQVLTFTSDGRVKFNGNLPSGTYYIISPNKMEYTINGQTFQMVYKIEEQKLYWGLDEQSMERYKWLGN